MEINKLKILNLYSGIGGNRKLWGDEHEITAVENNPEIAKHYFWANFYINPVKIETRGHHEGIESLEGLKGFDLSQYNGIDKRATLRNCVEPETGLHIFQEAFREYKTLF